LPFIELPSASSSALTGHYFDSSACVNILTRNQLRNIILKADLHGGDAYSDASGGRTDSACFAGNTLLKQNRELAV
jgi:hypothetical protein